MVTKNPLWLPVWWIVPRNFWSSGEPTTPRLWYLHWTIAEQAPATDAEVGPLVAGAADALDLVAERLEQLGDELLEPLGRQRGELLELQVGAAGLLAEPLGLLAALADRGADRLECRARRCRARPLQSCRTYRSTLNSALSIVLSSRARSARVNWF